VFSTPHTAQLEGERNLMKRARQKKLGAHLL